MKPEQVEGITVTAIGNELQLSWIYNQSSNKYGMLFYIYKSNDNNNFPIILSQPHQVTSMKKWIDYDVIPNNIYYYKICAVDHLGHFSLPSILVSGRTNVDDTPLRIKVDLEEKKRLNKKKDWKSK